MRRLAAGVLWIDRLAKFSILPSHLIRCVGLSVDLGDMTRLLAKRKEDTCWVRSCVIVGEIEIRRMSS